MLVPAVDLDFFDGAAAAPEDDAHRVGTAVERGRNEGASCRSADSNSSSIRLSRGGWTTSVNEATAVAEYVCDDEHVVVVA
jgi:hypothetical protein